MAEGPARFDDRALFGAFAGVALAFLAANAFTQLALRRIDAASDDIAFNSAPSIQHLAALRTAVRHVQFLLGAALTTDEGRAAAVEPALAQLNGEASAYLALPTFPGEKSLWTELNASIVAFDGAVQRAMAERNAGALGAARATLAEVSRAADRLSDASAAALEFNAANGRDVALRIKDGRRSAERVGYGLTTALAVLTLLAGALVRRTVLRNRALVEERAGLQERKAAELEAFAGRAAHDIRNPVSAAQLALALAAKRGIPDEKLRALVERALRSMARIRTVTDDLLEFARAGASPAPGATADVRAVLEDVTDGVRPTAEASGIELRVEPAAPCRACCSVGVLTSVVSNLAQNAVKYIGDRTPRRIVLRSAIQAGFVRVEVEDSGPGIPAELASDIFRPFVRGPAQGTDGFGLGLATVKRLCESHGGRVGVRSVVGHGSTFWVELPAREEPEVTGPRVAAADEGAPAGANGRAAGRAPGRGGALRGWEVQPAARDGGADPATG